MTPAKQKLLISGLIVLGVLIVAFFGVRAVRAFTLIRDWMTISYISKAYGVPDRMLFKELKIPDKGNSEKSLKVLNDEFFPAQAGYVLETVKQAISEHRPPTPPTAPAP